MKAAMKTFPFWFSSFHHCTINQNNYVINKKSDNFISALLIGEDHPVKFQLRISHMTINGHKMD